MNLSDAEFYSIAEAKAKFSKVIDDSKDHDVIITKNGIPISVVMNYDKFVKLMEFVEEIKDLSLFDLEDFDKFKEIQKFFKDFDY
jgi:prevent-host-death family protein